ncbi:putative glycoside hydrolase [Micromonospora sp. CB01531]|uniref:putative glycoside hydrolase n=1 Tax=Micromonospora sp. CB01531 TaxID=1718947 RepID=UPI00093CFBF1|nr:putative glycoside hydrolase [Micromonospora sp. CB01531]OKI54850.1 hypothetical protein A6A27_31480 [Micromonospora sp. CB01531]
MAGGLAALLGATAGGVPAGATEPELPPVAKAPCPAQDPTLTLPVPPEHGVSQAQVFDRQVTDPSVYGGRVQFVWGALSPNQPPGVVASTYITVFRNAPLRQYTYDWFKANHPDWIAYTADRVTPAWEFNNHVYTPLDVGNPEVRQWMFQNMIEPKIAAGFKVIAVDNVGVRNDFKRAGHYDADGNWVQQFNDDPKDPVYIDYLTDWLTYLRDGLHARGTAAAFNITYHGALHDQYRDDSPEYLEAISRAISISDIWLNEQGFTVHRAENVTDDEWLGMFKLVRKFRCHLMVIDSKLPTAYWYEATPQQREWVVANYFLHRERPTMMVSTGLKDYAAFNDVPEQRADIGTAITPPVKNGTTLWTRRYTQGLTVVNPSSTVTATLELPEGTFTDLHSNSYRGSVTLPPNSGLVLHAD